MTYKQWEAELLKNLVDIPDAETRAACEYYREIFGDKFDAGIEENKILEEFGSPKLCADRILSEKVEPVVSESEKPKAAVKERTKEPSTKEKISFSISKWVGIFFLVTLIIIPFASALVSVIAAFGAVAFTMAAMVVAGALGTIASPFTLLLGYTGWGALGAAGTCLAVAGVGALLYPPFYFLTKYSIVSSLKLAKYAIGRCKK